MIDYIKPALAYVQNTVKPLLSELRWFFEECDRRGIPLNEGNVKNLIDQLAELHIRVTIIQLIQNILLTGFALSVIWMILKD